MKQNDPVHGSITLRLFGDYQLRVCGKEDVYLKRPNDSIPVLAYLVGNSGNKAPVGRRDLIEAVLGMPPEAKERALQNSLAELRRVLAFDGVFERIPQRKLQFLPQDGDSIDVLDFEMAISKSRETNDFSYVEVAMDLYGRGLFLEEFESSKGIEIFRTRYLNRLAAELERLSQVARVGASYDVALSLLCSLMRVKPCEKGWGELIRAYVDTKQYENAYDIYVKFKGYGIGISADIQSEVGRIPADILKQMRKRRNLITNLRIDILPRADESFGCEKAIAELQELLVQEQFPLIALTGSAGVGKTHLAVKLGHNRTVQGRFPHGVKFVEILAVSEPDQLLPTIIATLRIPVEANAEDLFTQLANWLRDREVLLILDNCDHHFNACIELIGRLLNDCPALHILVTSRQILGINEKNWAVLPLVLPTESTNGDLNALQQSPAVQLFAATASRVQRTFRLTASNAGKVAEICRLVDGLPLAIKLAAAHFTSLSPDVVDDLLGRLLSIPLSKNGKTPDHRRTLAALIAWSHERLSEYAGRLFPKLAVFEAGWSEEAAMQVCATGDLSPVTIRSALAELEDHALIACSTATTRRFSMLETTKAYCIGSLSVAGGEWELRQRHRDYMLGLATKLNAKLDAPEHADSINEFTAEYPNIDRAIKFCLEDPHGAEAGLRFASVLQGYLPLRGNLKQSREIYARLLAHADSEERTEFRASALNGAGALAAASHDYASARLFYEESLEIYQEHGDYLRIAIVKGNLGIAAWNEGHFAEGFSLWEESLSGHREMRNREGVAKALGNLGIASLRSQPPDFELACRYLQECLTISKDSRNPLAVALCNYYLGEVAKHRPDLSSVSARSYFESALESHHKLGNLITAISCLEAIVGLDVADSDWFRVAVVLVTLDRIRKSLDLAPLSVDEKSTLENARTELGADKFSQAQDMGTSMTLKQVVGYALRRDDRGIIDESSDVDE